MNTIVKFEFTSTCTVIMWLENTDENKIFFVRSSHHKHFGKAQYVVRWALWWHQKEMLERIIFFIKLSRNFLNMFMYNFLKKKTVNSPINVLPLISATSKNQKKVYKHLPFLKTLLLTNVSHPKEALIRKIIAWPIFRWA